MQDNIRKTIIPSKGGHSHTRARGGEGGESGSRETRVFGNNIKR